jgi:hypothetical protein
LDRILAYRTPRKLLPIVEEFLHAMAPYESPERAKRFRNIRRAMQDRKFQDDLEQDESLNFLLRNTISLTLGGAERTNVILPRGLGESRRAPASRRGCQAVPGDDRQLCRASPAATPRTNPYRPLGIEAHGFTSYTATDAEGSTEHGNDERVRLEEVRRAPKTLFDVVMALAGTA